jgi:Protein of unknown function (DUF1189)
MVFLRAFLHSIKLPKKKAIFQLNRIGMDITIFYILLLLFIVSLPAFIDYLLSSSKLSNALNIFFKIIYFFIFNYLPLSIIVFMLISLIAAVGTGLAKLMQRKLKYSILWKMTAYTTTIPFLVYSLAALFLPIGNMYLLIFCIYSLFFIVLIISVYPKRRKK